MAIVLLCSWTWTALERSCQPVVPPGETPSEDVDEQGRDQEGQEKNLQVHYLISVWLVTHSPADLFCPWPMAEVGSRQRGQRSSKPRSSRWPDVRAPAHCSLEDVTAIFQPLSSIWKETMKKLSSLAPFISSLISPFSAILVSLSSTSPNCSIRFLSSQAPE